MRVQQLIELLSRYNPDADVRIRVTLTGQVIDAGRHITVQDYGGGPQIAASFDLGVPYVYAGCGFQSIATDSPPTPPVDLGRYDNPIDAARVRDFYAIHRGLNEPLNYPDFDYDHWVPPRTISGQYNPVIAQILRAKLLRD